MPVPDLIVGPAELAPVLADFAHPPTLAPGLRPDIDPFVAVALNVRPQASQAMTILPCWRPINNPPPNGPRAERTAPARAEIDHRGRRRSSAIVYRGPPPTKDRD